MKKHLPGCPCSRCPRRSLPCGCIPGVKPCAEAERLWEAVADAHHAYAKERRVSRSDRLFRRFELALDAYNAHLQSVDETAEQAVLV